MTRKAEFKKGDRVMLMLIENSDIPLYHCTVTGREAKWFTAKDGKRWVRYVYRLKLGDGKAIDQIAERRLSRLPDTGFTDKRKLRIRR